MSICRGEATTLTYYAWDTVNNVPKTGDAANHTFLLRVDGTSTTPSLTSTEISNSSAKGGYEVSLSGTQTNGKDVTLYPTSSTAGIYIVPVQIQPNQLSSSAPGTSGGMPLIGSAPLTNLDVAISTRSTYAGGAVQSVTNPVTVNTVTDKTGYKLASDGLDTISTTLTAGAASTFPGRLNQLVQRILGKSVKTRANGTFVVYLPDNTTPMISQNWTDDGTGNESITSAT